jgi:DNA-binding NarL/FixJ family response regulator
MPLSPTTDLQEDGLTEACTVPPRRNGSGFKLNIGMLLIEPRPLTRRCFGQWLEQHVSMARLVSVSTPEEAIEIVGRPKDTGLVIWSIGADSIADAACRTALDRLKAGFPEVPIVLLADRESVAEIADAVRRGVRGYVPTSLDWQEIAGILGFVSAGGTYVPANAVLEAAGDRKPGKISPLRPAGRFKDLTPREIDVVEHLRLGKPNKVIAHELKISESTVKVFVHRIMTKLQAINRTEVACLAQQQLEHTDAAG